MKFIKNHIGSIIFISTFFIINAVLLITIMVTNHYKFDAIASSLSGSSLLIGFFLVFLLSTKAKWIISIFGGLDGLYFWHRLLAIGTTTAIFLHQIASENVSLFNRVELFLLGESSDAGELARNGFLFLIAFALLAKFVKYEHFKFIHRLLVIPYFLSLYHGFFSSWVNLFTFDILSIWMISTSIIGLGSSLYMLLIYQTTAFKNKGIIVEKTVINDTILELKVKMRHSYRFKAGQFAFIKIESDGISKAAHPFSISGQDEEHLYFTIKNLGDYTESLFSNLDTPSRINITNPYGSMIFESESKKQVWVAGGIGVTPFLSFIRSNQNTESDIHLIYTVKDKEEAVHLPLLDKASNEVSNFDYSLFISSKQGYLSSTDLNLDDDTTVYMCGPRPMVQSLNKQIHNIHPNVQIHFEAFSFTGTLVEDLLEVLKRIIYKLKPLKA